MTQCARTDSTAITDTVQAKAEHQQEEEGLSFNPPLYSQRAQVALNVLKRYACRRVVDAGCACGDLLLFVMHACSLHHTQLTEVTAIDLDEEALRKTDRTLPHSAFSVASFTEDCAVQCIHGDLTSSATIPAEWLPYSCTASGMSTRDATGCKTAAAVDAVLSIEVIEHIPPHLVAAYTYTVFAHLGAARGARVVLLTTPNRDENGRMPRHAQPPQQQQQQQQQQLMSKGNATGCTRCCTEQNSIYRPWEDAPRRRHSEHFFELTRAQWLRYVRYVEACYGGYWRPAAAHNAVAGGGKKKEEEEEGQKGAVLLGNGFTQGTLFIARPETQRAPVMSREAAIAAFPFEEIFGMAAADYAAHFLCTTATTSERGGDACDRQKASHHPKPCSDAAPQPQQAAPPSSVEQAGVDALFSLMCRGSAVPYVRVEHRVVKGVGLWDRLCDVVRRSSESPFTVSSSAFSLAPTKYTKRGRPRAILFGEFYTTRIAPLLYVILEKCALPLLLQALAAQQALWVQSLRGDAAQWRGFVRRIVRQRPSLRRCVQDLCARGAHIPYRSASACRLKSALEVAPLTWAVPCAGGRPHKKKEEESGTIGVDAAAAAAVTVLLFPYPSVASQALSDVYQDGASLQDCCVDGMEVLERGTANSASLLLVEWLCAEVASHQASFAKDLRTAPQRRKQEGQELPMCLTSPLFTPPPECAIGCLPVYLLQLLFFLVSMDVLPDTYKALCAVWGRSERHFSALHRDVSAVLEATCPRAAAVTTVSAAAGSQRRPSNPRQRRRRTALPGEAKLPFWLECLLQSPICLP
ncbi:hypothetical protein N2W54_005519 [Lotmaria passim]